MLSFCDVPENVKDTLITSFDFAGGTRRVWDNVAFLIAELFAYFIIDRIF